ncbi:N-acetylmuramoyl-L-alanine amidase [Adlercreutzia muris]|uniref:peptidoglycan recognition protein family protein n=1 Tax=Adlercreutzia muris TaxID=1796610 RepID=UPI001365900B|nr:N-acetylmuramoyl-L-alanine amidase [Adlercreutzia muris]NCA32111.1 N-acetylmuramoyl-L-alanine amidase [Adlercreutzia muris]
MKINETNLKFGSLSNRGSTSRIILHHAEATSCTPEQIHQWHLANGWSGAGYHFLVRKDGAVYALRPEWAVGAHAQGANSDSIGVCFEGRYQTEEMPQPQIDAGRELVAYLKGKYGLSKVQRHKDVGSTDCPGKNFPFEDITAAATAATSPSNPAGSKPAAATAKPAAKGDAWVRSLQTECNAQGFSKQTVDGIAGPNTLAGCPTLRKGANGNITKLMQQRLVALGYSLAPYGADGSFGDVTLAAVKKFQKARDLTADGIVGQNTWRELLGL